MRVNLDYNESFEMWEQREERIAAVFAVRRNKGLPSNIGIDWFPPGWPEYRGPLWMTCFYRSSSSWRWRINYTKKLPFVKVSASTGKTLLSSFSITLNYTIFLFVPDALVLDVYSNRTVWKVTSIWKNETQLVIDCNCHWLILYNALINTMCR